MFVILGSIGLRAKK